MVQAVGEHLPFRDGLFDAVMIMQTLDHCASPERLLAQAHRVLRPAGQVLIQQVVQPGGQPPKTSWLRRWRRRLIGAAVDSSETKTHRFTSDGLPALLGPRFALTASQMPRTDNVFLRASAIK
jgi:ubiquinone/menaquinone biosynthesis C-methylase UbiE